MNFKIGDLVRFVDEPIEGHITSIQANNIIGVTDESGFEIPVLASKVTLVHGNMRREDDDIIDNVAAANLPFVEEGVYLAVEGEQKDGLAKFYIVNHTSYDLLIAIAEVSGPKCTGIFAEKVLKRDFVQFYSANFGQVGKWPNFHVQLIKHSKQARAIPHPIAKEFRVKPLDLINSKEADDIMEAKVWRFQLDKPEENIGLDKLKSHFISHRPNKK
ncbi:hypothetical protein [Sphingobacterium wenxiniae]|uniref:Uncharacterized protein n=1 Tax=Sphingobacterium wenxiniae TaxID=683125 RepID=A0A1I6VJJ6_9SPHI|nr:hypothetical protein [Sphingobacterium wenxiniae]SFT13827.1 hypothetical protein SAMN05660206_11458 [Sphingobacterium wenxiniae]